MILPIVGILGGYRIERIVLPDWSPFGASVRRWLGGIHVTDDGTVSGFLYAPVGPHGDNVNARSFVAAKGRSWLLPLGSRSHGHVVAAIDGKLVGDVFEDDPRKGYVRKAAVWTADPVLGWAKANLTILPGDETWGVAISPYGEIWTDGQKGLRRFDGKVWAEKRVDRFDLVGIDERERLWGNRYESLGEGFSRIGQKGGCYMDGRWTSLPSGMIVDSNDAVGDAAGTIGNHAARWSHGRLDVLDDGASYSRARSISPDGSTVGSVGSKAVLWKEGVAVDLSFEISGAGSTEALAISPRGLIAVEAVFGREPRLYLFHPR